MTCGDNREALEQIRKRRGKIAPGAIQPIIPLWCYSFLKAYSFLSARRQHSMGSPLAIPLTEMLAYAKTFGFEFETKLLILCITSMDSEYFEFQNKKAEAQSRKSKK